MKALGFGSCFRWILNFFAKRAVATTLYTDFDLVTRVTWIEIAWICRDGAQAKRKTCALSSRNIAHNAPPPLKLNSKRKHGLVFHLHFVAPAVDFGLKDLASKGFRSLGCRVEELGNSAVTLKTCRVVM